MALEIFGINVRRSVVRSPARVNFHCQESDEDEIKPSIELNKVAFVVINQRTFMAQFSKASARPKAHVT